MIGYYGFMPAPVMTPEATRSLANARAENTSDGLVEPAREMNTPQPAAEVPVPKLTTIDLGKLRSAALRATRLYPGVVGEVLSRELLTWESFAFRFGADGTIRRLVEHVMNCPLPDDDLPAAA